MVLNEGRYRGEFILMEQDGTLSRSTVILTVAASTKLPAGTVVGRLTGTGKYVVYDNDATDGSETARGVTYDNNDNSAGVAPADFNAVVLDFGAELRRADLNFGTSDAGKIAAAVADLLAVAIKLRS